MLEALDFEGFRNARLLVQAYLPHKERVYKVYGLGQWFTAPVRRSIPDDLMRSAPAYKFDSQEKFDPKQYKEYDENDCLLDMPMMKKFFEKFPAEFNMVFYGIDVIVDTRDGSHNIVDCNYMGNYYLIEFDELCVEADKLISDQIDS